MSDAFRIAAVSYRALHLKFLALENKLAAAQAEIAELKEELNDKRRFCYEVELALDGLKGDYIEIIKELRKECGK